MFGLGVALGALLIGLPYAFLWGSLAAVLRFIPYVGPWAAALLVSVAGLAVFDGWLQPVLIAALFIALELFTNLVLETYLYSQSAGVSQVALLVAVAFWTWIWGPVGLALATPLTVCLVVLAKYVPDLEIVSILMSDEPVMGPARSYYQRLVARDENEAATLVQDYIASHPGHDLYDEVFVPALNHGATTITSGGESPRPTCASSSRPPVELIEELDLSEPPAEPALRPATSVLGLPAQEEADEIALQMLKQRLDPTPLQRGCRLSRPPGQRSHRGRGGARAGHGRSSVPWRAPGHPLHLRYLCKRLRARFPDLSIVVGWWGADGGDEAARDAMVAAGADRVTVSIAEACAQLQELAPLRRVPEPTGKPYLPSGDDDAPALAHRVFAARGSVDSERYAHRAIFPSASNTASHAVMVSRATTPCRLDVRGTPGPHDA